MNSRLASLHFAACSIAIAAACTAARGEGRTQNFLTSASEVNSQAAVLFREIKSKSISRGSLIESGERYERVNAIAQRVIESAHVDRPDSQSWAWEVILINEDVKNAFCLPGGKIAIYTGLVDGLALDDDEVAAVIAHEVAHALREHGREKRSNAAVANVAVGILAVAAGIAGYKHKTDPNRAMNIARLAGGATAQLFFLLPNSREMELEADAIGVTLAARSGFDPGAAQSLWRKLSSVSRLEFLSTHPSPETRASELTAVVASANDKFAEKRMASGATKVSYPVQALAKSEQRSIGVATIVGCALPDGTVASLALMACQRLGGSLKEIEK